MITNSNVYGVVYHVENGYIWLEYGNGCQESVDRMDLSDDEIMAIITKGQETPKWTN